MIEQLFLRNFKCFESQAIRIGDLTLLSGLNGMGKSSVLQSILLLRQSYLDGLLPATGLALNGSLVKLGTARDVFFEGAQGDDFEIGVTWRDGTHTSFVLEYHREAEVLKIHSGPGDQNAFAHVPFTDAFHYVQAERLGPRSINALSEFQVREHRQMGTAGEFAGHFLEIYGAETVKDDILCYPGSKSNNLRSQVQAWLQEISPGAEVHLAMHPEMDVVNLRYSFVTGEQRSNSYRSTSVGFGITYALPILIAILSSKLGSIVLIENPEAHLHPRGQAKIGELMARAAVAGIQVIAETHSDHVLNGVRLAVHAGIISPEAISICYFSRTEDSGRVHSVIESPSIDKDGRLDKWPDGFFDEWDKSLERLLAPRKETL